MVPALLSMAGSTDIPDWTSHETGLAYTWQESVPENLTAMFNKSPISHVDKVIAPIFLMIGDAILAVKRLKHISDIV